MHYGKFHFMHSETDALWVNIILCNHKKMHYQLSKAIIKQNYIYIALLQITLTDYLHSPPPIGIVDIKTL